MLTLEEREFNAVVKESLRSIAKSLKELVELQRERNKMLAEIGNSSKQMFFPAVGDGGSKQ